MIAYMCCYSSFNRCLYSKYSWTTWNPHHIRWNWPLYKLCSVKVYYLQESCTLVLVKSF